MTALSDLYQCVHRTGKQAGTAKRFRTGLPTVICTFSHQYMYLSTRRETAIGEPDTMPPCNEGKQLLPANSIDPRRSSRCKICEGRQAVHSHLVIAPTTDGPSLLIFLCKYAFYSSARFHVVQVSNKRGCIGAKTPCSSLTCKASYAVRVVCLDYYLEATQTRRCVKISFSLQCKSRRYFNREQDVIARSEMG